MHSKAKTNQDTVSISLTKDEAIVLFNFLSRFSQSNSLNIEDQSEERALWNLTCRLEEKLVEPFMEDWKKILTSSREKLRDKS